MRWTASAFLLCIILFLAACGGGTVSSGANSVKPPKQPSAQQPVLVEMFTSEGCGNCPPADQQLAFLETQQPVPGADVITLGYHVDYFNDKGWKDEYSSAEYTRRQALYSLRLNVENVYTPQMIVDGKAQFVGSDAAKASSEIAKASGEKKGTVNATRNGKLADVAISGIGPHTVATVVLAVAEDGLVSDVNAGNNRGKKLPHVSVVRKLIGFGKVPEKASEFKGLVELPSDPAWKSENVRYVIYAQEDTSGRIIAAGRLKPGQ